MTATDLIERLQAERPYWGVLAAGMRFKQALVARLGPEAAFPLARAELRLPGLDRLRRCRLVSIADRVSAGAGHRPWPRGHDASLPAPTVVGVAPEPPLPYHARTPWLACLDDVVLRGRSDLLLHGDDELLIDAEAGEYDPAQDNLEFDPAVLQAGQDEAWVMAPERVRLQHDEALAVCGAYAPDFGHWLLDYLPRLALARLAGWPGGMPVLVDATLPATVREALPALLPTGTPVVEVPNFQPVRVRRLWTAAHPIHFGLFPSDDAPAHPRHLFPPGQAAMLFRELRRLTDAATGAPTGADRLYLARRPERRKRLVNHEQIEALVDRHGFRRVYPEDLGLLEQIRLVRHARFIVAPEGSNSLLALLASAGARTCIFGPPTTRQLTLLSVLAREQGIDPVLFVGPAATDSPGHTDHPTWSFWNDYRIDAQAFEAFLAGWLDGR